MKTLYSLLRCREALGLAAGMLVLTCLPIWKLLLTEPGWLFALLVLLSSIAGFIMGSVAVQHGDDASSATRAGAWAAFFTALVGAAVFALIARLGLSWIAITRAGIAGGLTLLPASFYGMLCSGIAAVTLMPKTTIPKEKTTDLPIAAVWGARAMIAALVLAAVFFPPSSPVRIAEPVMPQSVHPAPPTRPSFSFTPPQGIDKADVLQWKLVKQREFSGLDATTVVLSRDDRFAAAVLSNGQTIQLMELQSSNISQVKVPGRIAAFSLHPDNHRIFVLYFAAADEMRCGVADVRTEGFILLPKPSKGTIPNLSVLWWKDKQVLFARDKERHILNLDTLEFEAAERVEVWKLLDPVIQDKLVRELTAPELDNLRWEWRKRQIVLETELPAVAETSHWPVKYEVCLALTHSSLDNSKVFPQIKVGDSDRLIASRDGSIVLQAGNGMLTQYCFELDTALRKTWKIKMPRSPAQGEDGPETQLALESGELAALVYAPMINPLNQQVVGAMRSEVAAVLRFKSWIDHEAEVYLWQSYRPIRDQDIIADICIMPEDMNGSLLSSPDSQRWWMKMEDASRTPIITDEVPEQKTRAEMLEKVKKRVQAAKEAQLAKEAAEKQKQAEEAERLAKAERDKAAAMESASLEAAMKAEAAARQSEVEQGLKKQLAAFVLKHHQKSREGDVESLVEDYATKVDYFDKGVVTRSWILEDETKYHSTQVILDERIISDIVIKPDLKSGGYEALYDLRLHAQNITNNKVSGGDFSTRLIIGPTNEGFKIILHHSWKKP